MQERIYINGVLMEQSDTKGISLVYQSQLFSDIDSIVSNRTNSVDFPMTRNNLLAIDRSHLPGIDSIYAYRRHRAIYIRDGLRLRGEMSRPSRSCSTSSCTTSRFRTYMDMSCGPLMLMRHTASFMTRTYISVQVQFRTR